MRRHPAASGDTSATRKLILLFSVLVGRESLTHSSSLMDSAVGFAAVAEKAPNTAMAKKTQTPSPRPADLGPVEMKVALPKLQRRIEELKSVDVSQVQKRSDPTLEALEHKIDATLIEIFGNDTVEYHRYSIRDLDTAPIYWGTPTPLHEVREGYRRGIERALTNLQTIIDLFNEKLADLGETPSGQAVKAFSQSDLHPEIERAVAKLFKGGHYANAVEDACKVLDGLVRLRSGVLDQSGTDLMLKVFSPKNPVLRFNSLQTETDRSEQQGMMHLFAGAMLAFRNPRAHQIIQDHPERAQEIITFLSLLAKVLDNAERA